MKQEKIKLFSMFSGYGGAEFALKKTGIDFETVGYSEIDKYAIQCYEKNHSYVKAPLQFKASEMEEAIRNASLPKNFGDATKIDPADIPDFDLLTAGFSCQAFSVAGKGLGEQDTRGTLFHEIIRIAEAKKPKYMLLENVKGLTSKRHKATFNKILSELDRIGYCVEWKVLNTKEHGVPQNRERVFFVCKHMEDLDSFDWPEKEELNIFLKDILEPEVEEKYYLREKQMSQLLYNNNWNCNPSGKGMNGKIHQDLNVSPTITTNKGEGAKIIQLNNPKHSNNRVYSKEGISPALNTMQGGNRQPFIAASRGRNPSNTSDRTTGSPTEQRLEPKFDGTTNCLSTVQKDNYVVDSLTIRKLTPTECFRLQGFLKDEINLEGISNSQRYKLAGNGWEISLVSKIFKMIFKEK